MLPQVLNTRGRRSLRAGSKNYESETNVIKWSGTNENGCILQYIVDIIWNISFVTNNVYARQIRKKSQLV